MAVTPRPRRVADVAAAVAGASDEVWVVVGLVAVIAGVALIYLPAAVIAGGVCSLVIGIGRMRT